MLLPEEVENQRFANMDRTGSTLPLEVESNHDPEEISFEPASATPCQHELVTPRHVKLHPAHVNQLHLTNWSQLHLQNPSQIHFSHLDYYTILLRAQVLKIPLALIMSMKIIICQVLLI